MPSVQHSGGETLKVRSKSYQFIDVFDTLITKHGRVSNRRMRDILLKKMIIQGLRRDKFVTRSVGDGIR